MNCKVSGQYGKDNDKVLHFYCENCGKEMEYNEKRICFAENGTQSPTPNYNDILQDILERFAKLARPQRLGQNEQWTGPERPYIFDYGEAMAFVDKEFQQALTLATERAVKKKENETKTIIKKNVKEINWWFIKNADKKGGRIYEGMENQMYALNDILSQLTKE